MAQPPGSKHKKLLNDENAAVIIEQKILEIIPTLPGGTTDISGKVDKVTGHSLVADTEIEKIHAPGSDDQDLSGKSNVGHTHSYEPANSNIQIHIGSAHAPSNAQKNSDITGTEIESKLIGEITSHTHPGAPVG